MTFMSETHMRLSFLSLLILLYYVFLSSSFPIGFPVGFPIGFPIDDPVAGLVACHPHQIQAFTQFKSEFDTGGCNHSDKSNGVWCDNSTGEITKLQLRACLSGSLKPNSSLFKLHHLRYLNLSFNSFTPSLLPSEFGNLNRLKVLSLSNNGFLGQVPPTISNLTRLTHLSLAKNKFTSRFPPVENLTELSVLQLDCNNFSGTIPSSLLTMPFLSYVDIRGNHFTGSFEVPDSSTSSSLKTLLLGDNSFGAQILEPISNLINLTTLDLSFLNTSYPVDLGLFSNLKSLLYLDLSGNNIDPNSLSLDSYIPLTLQNLYLKRCGIKEFPKILKTLHNLEILSLSENLIKGEIPEWLWSLPRLSSVFMGFNFFSGFEGSGEVLVNSSVQTLSMESNHFQGALPDLPLSIIIITLCHNNFTGEIPLSICNRSSLDVVFLGHNSLTGPIPQCLSNFWFVNLRNNNLEGSIPDVFHVGTSLQKLDVSFNQITGKLPRSLINCSSLKFLFVDNNKIEDTFPFFLKALPNLVALTLKSNKFYGPISPHHHGPLGFPTLHILEIAHNKFTGSLSQSYFVDWKAPSVNEDGGLYLEYHHQNFSLYPNNMDLEYKGLHMEQVWVLNSFSAIDFSGNLLEGNIPESIGFLKSLIALNLSNNGFTGHIPLSLANLTKLESLDMSRNQLSGTIPNGLGSLSFLAFINVSHNQLRGEIPQGTQITGQPRSSFEGNAWLCGLPLKENCFDSSALPTHQQEDDEEEEEEEVLNWKGVAAGYGFGVLFGFILAQVIASYKSKWFSKIIGLFSRLLV